MESPQHNRKTNVHVHVRERLRENQVDVEVKNCWQVPGRHIVFRKERNLENLCAGDDNFLACRGNSFSCDAVNLVECVRPQITVIRCPDEHLQVHWFLTEANELLKKWRRNYEKTPLVIFHQLLLVSIVSVIIQKENGKILWVFCRGNQGDGNFQVGLQNHIIPGALYSWTLIFLTGCIHLKALFNQVKLENILHLYHNHFPPKHFHPKDHVYVQLLPKSSSMHINIRR